MKNIKRYRRELEKEGHPLAARDEAGNFIHLNIIPTSFMLPSEYSMWVEEHKRNPHQVWIVKPAAGARGVGIFLVRNPKDIKAWAPVPKRSGSGALPSIAPLPEKPESIVQFI